MNQLEVVGVKGKLHSLLESLEMSSRSGGEPVAPTIFASSELSLEIVGTSRYVVVELDVAGDGAGAVM